MSTPSLAERDWSGDVVRYPDPAVEVLDDRFSKYRIGNAVVERLFTGCRWAEGPVWFGDARCLIWSDIPNNRMLRWTEETEEVSVYRSPTGHSKRQHARPAGQTRHLRAHRPPRIPHRT